MKRSQTSRDRGRSNYNETIKKDLKINKLDNNIVFDRTLWRSLIHVADPS